MSEGRNGTGHVELGKWNSAMSVNVCTSLIRDLSASQLCHVAIWGSIASWFIFLLIYCIPGIALYIAPDMIGQVWLFSHFSLTALYKVILTSMSVDETLVLSKLTCSQSSLYSARHGIGAEGYWKGENKRGLDYLPIALCSRSAR